MKAVEPHCIPISPRSFFDDIHSFVRFQLDGKVALMCVHKCNVLQSFSDDKTKIVAQTAYSIPHQ